MIRFFLPIVLVTAVCAETPPTPAREKPRPDLPTRELLTTPKTAVAYVSFQGQQRALFPWIGEHVAFQTQTADLDPVTRTRLVEVFDRLWRFYVDATGREPAPNRSVDGRLSIAVEPSTCGAACGYIGTQGIELTPPCFDVLYAGIRKDGSSDQVLPYEFGRKFWFYGDQLEYVGARNRLARREVTFNGSIRSGPRSSG